MAKDTKAKNNKNKEQSPEDIMIELQVLSGNVNEAVNIIKESKKKGLKANANDIMTLYKTLGNYEAKLNSYIRRAFPTSRNNNQAQFVDLVARIADAKDNKRIIGKYIANSMDLIKFDADEYKKKLSENLSSKDLKKEEAKGLIDALDNYKNVMSLTIGKNLEVNKANAKQKVIDACVGLVKASNVNPEALNVVYDIAAIMGEQNEDALSNVMDEDLGKLVTRRYIGYKNTATKSFDTHYFGYTTPPQNAPENTELFIQSISGKNQQEKEAAYEQYLMDLYANDPYSRFEAQDRKKAEAELGPNASEEEMNKKLGEVLFKRMPWNNLKLDDTVTSKEKFVKRQEVMRQWFPDDMRLLYGATAQKNQVRNFYNILTNGTYNGFFRSFKNSPEYEGLLTALDTYANKLETDPKKNEENYEAVKTACKNYIKHFDGKSKKDKSEFAIMRKDKVSELLEVLESNAKEAVKEAENKKGIRTSAKKLEEEKPEKKTTRQSKAQPKTKDINKSK